MYLINFTYEISEDEQKRFVERIKALELFWKSQGFEFSIFREISRKSRLIHSFYTDRSIDELSYLIQEHPEAKALFEEIRESTGKIIIRVLEQIA
jgi:hypothetical protein